MELVHWSGRQLLASVAGDAHPLVPGHNCTPAAYHEFPADLFSDRSREVGAVLIHILVVAYIFTALAVVCDDYFVPSLGLICERLGFSEDVAGATFMAAGSSAPELFTSTIGVFVAKGDVGTGTIVGSAVFNILAIVGLCGVLTTEPVALNWWPLLRDSAFYALSIVMLILVIKDGVVTWWESILMLALYALYILIMKYNTRLRSWTTEKLGAHLRLPDVVAGRADYDDVPGAAIGGTDTEKGAPYQGSSAAPSSALERANLLEAALSQIRTARRRLNVWEVILLYFTTRRFSARKRIWAAAKLITIERRRLIRSGRLSPVASFDVEQAARRDDFNRRMKRSFSRQLTTDDPDEPAFDDWRKRPSYTDTPLRDFLSWHAMAPIKFAFALTIPDCRKTAYEGRYPFSFGISIAWIAGLSYIMVWMVTVVGYTMGIPDSIMGITFLAAGTSIPDAMASVIVARKGQGDMAVSNSVGSNVFDILLGLAFPWFLRTAIASPGSIVRINSGGIVFSVVLLFLTVGALVGGVALNGWRLDRRLGIICLALYGVFITFSCLIESNVFGFVNPPNCPVM